MCKLRNAAIEALVAIAQVSGLDSRLEGMTIDQWADLRDARRSLIDALRMGGIPEGEFNALDIINHLAMRLTMDSETRAIGDRIQQAVLPAIIERAAA